MRGMFNYSDEMEIPHYLITAAIFKHGPMVFGELESRFYYICPKVLEDILDDLTDPDDSEIQPYIRVRYTDDGHYQIDLEANLELLQINLESEDDTLL
jgi:hypothetical protein